MEEVYRFYGEGLEAAQPPPPSETGSEFSFPEVSKEQEDALKLRREGRNKQKWLNPSIPKLDSTGKLGALWDEEFKSQKKRGSSSSVLIEGKDCLALVRCLKDSWLSSAKSRKPDGALRQSTSVPKNHSALTDLVAFADMVGLEETESFETLSVRPYRSESASKHIRRKWKNAEASERERARTRRRECVEAMKAAVVASKAVTAIDSAERQVRKTLESVTSESQRAESAAGRSKHKHFGCGEDLVDYAATSIQSAYRGYALRKALQDLVHAELSKLELALTRQAGDAFEKRDRKALNLRARRTAAAKLLQDRKECEEEKVRFVHCSTVEVTRLATDEHCSVLQQTMDNKYETYVQDLWRALATVRSYFIESSNRNDLGNIREYLEDLPSYGQDDQVAVDCIRDTLKIPCPALSQHQVNMICAFLDNRLTGYVHIALAEKFFRGPLSDRRLFVASEAFARLKQTRSTAPEEDSFEAGIYSSRLERLEAFFAQYAPEQAHSNKARMLDKKYKNDETTNKRLFKKLYLKHAPWITPPAVLWKTKLQAKAAYDREVVGIHTLFQRYHSVLREDKALPRSARIAITRMLNAVQSSASDDETKYYVELPERSFTYADFVGLHVELSASVESVRQFEDIVCRACGIKRKEWEAIVQRRIIAEDRLAPNLLREAEHEKLQMLRKVLGARSFEAYESRLLETTRKIRASLVPVCGTDKSYNGLMRTFLNLGSFGNDRKVSSLDLKSALTKYGIILTESDFDILSKHYDHNDTGFISVDAFMFGIRESISASRRRANKANEFMSAADEQKLLRAWSRKVRQTMIPEKTKEWQTFQCPKTARNYWYCSTTGERRWHPPKSVLKQERREVKAHGLRRLRAAIEQLQVYRAAAKAEMEKQIEKVKSRSTFALPLAGSSLEDLPRGLAPVFRHIQTAWFDENSFRVFPRALCTIPHLLSLSINSNKLEALPKRISGLSSLKVLSVRGNHLKRVPVELSSLSCLEELDLSNNEVASLPDTCLVGLHHLKYLDLSFNRLTSLPEEQASYKALGRLKWLSLENNRFEQLPGALFQHLGALLTLDISSNSIRDLPRQMVHLKAVTTLNVSSNALETIPSPILSLHGIQVLILEHNHIMDLPQDLSGLSNLRKLSIAHNSVQELPRSIGSLHALEELSLEANSILTLPSSFGQLSSLRSLLAGSNKLTSLPNDLPIRLVELRLCNNKLGAFPTTAGRLQDLRKLDLGYNNIRTLPLTMRNLEGLEYLRLEGCPLSPTLAKIREEGEYKSSAEENYLLLLRKFIDGLRAKDIQSRVDSVLGIPEIRPKTSHSRRKAKSIYHRQEIRLYLTEEPKSKNWAEQILLEAFQRFAEAEGSAANSAKFISEAAFRKCVQTVGSLLSACEVDRLTARAFKVLECDKTGRIAYETFVSSIVRTATGKQERSKTSHATSLAISSKHYRVARAVVRFCVSQHVKGIAEENKLVFIKNKVATPAQNLETLVNKYRMLRAKKNDLKKEVKKTSQEAKIVEKIASHTERMGLLGKQASTKKATSIAAVLSSPRDRKDGDVLEHRRVVRQAIREEQRDIRELEMQLRKSRITAADYEAMRKLQQAQQREKARVRKQAERRLDKAMLAQLFHEHSSEVAGLSEAVVSKGDMLAAVGDFYRLYCNGRNGLTPKEWRTKLLRTVNAAFTEGWDDPATGRQIPFDDNQDGFLDFNSFSRFFSKVYQKEAASRTVAAQEGNDFIHKGVLYPKLSEEETHVVKKNPVDQLPTYLYVDLISASAPLRVELPDLKTTTVKQLKSKIEFKEAVPKSQIVLVFNGRRLEDHTLLSEHRIQRGNTVKALIIA